MTIATMMIAVSLTAIHQALSSVCDSIAVAKGFDLRGGLDAAVGNDPLEHSDALLKLLDLAAQPNIFLAVDRLAAHFAHRARGDAELVLDDGEGEHQDQDREYEFKGIYRCQALLPLARMS